MTGSVSVQPRGTDDWVQGSANRPLTNADNVWADKDSRAELNLGTGVFRISSETSLTLTNIDNNAVQVQLHQGTLNLHIRKLYDGEVYEVDTPNLAFTVTMSTGLGVKPRTMETSGFRPRLGRIGRLTAMDIGLGLILGDGPGSMMLHGGSPRTTMAAGYRLAVTGAGLLDLIGYGRGMRPLWWPGSEARAGELALVLAVASDGARWDLVSHSFHGTARAAVISETSTSVTRVSSTSRTSPTTITTTGMATECMADTALRCRVMQTIPGL
jgi:hypothetical protein